MVQGLKLLKMSQMRLPAKLAILVPVLTLLSGCLQTTQSVLSDFCSQTEKSLPILLSRKDTAPTQRDVAELNAKHERLCKDGQS